MGSLDIVRNHHTQYIICSQAWAYVNFQRKPWPGSCASAQVVRSCGSSIVWVYSTLLIQLRVPNELQGRMMALEMALYVVRAACSRFLCFL